MEMIDVLQKLREIAETKPELVKDALENVEKTNPKTVTEGGMKDYLHDEAEKLSREEFIKKHGESLAGFWDSINGTEEAVEGKLPAGLQAYQDKKAGKEDKDVPAGSHKMPDGTIMKDKDHKKEEDAYDKDDEKPKSKPKKEEVKETDEKKETHTFMAKDMNQKQKDAKGEKEVPTVQKTESVIDAVKSVWQLSAEQLEKIKDEAKYMKAERMHKYKAEKDDKNKKGTADTGSKETKIDTSPEVDYAIK